MDTIFALASARGKAGVSVFRVSGPLAFDAARDLTGEDLPPRRPVLRKVRDADGRHLDTGLLIGFPEGQSFTGEPVVEFQLHGSPAVTSALLKALEKIYGLRSALPGEFTRRALENGRIDLTQVEGLADLVEAETELQRRMALSVADGSLRRKSEAWRAALLRAAALIEATIDFADEEVPTDVGPEAAAILDALATELVAETEGARAAERVRDGFEVAIVGRPNIGKSTLLNALAGRDAAITSEIAGTTRDVIEVRMDLAGIPVTLLDTAGVRETADALESIGVGRARDRAERADLRVFLVDEGTSPVLTPESDDLVVIAKGDLYEGKAMSVSGKTGAGLGTLVDSITERLAARVALSATATRLRQQRSISEALVCITAARSEIGLGEARIEYASEELHRGIRALDMLLGQVDVENVLDEIFASFCLGK